MPNRSLPTHLFPRIKQIGALAAQDVDYGVGASVSNIRSLALSVAFPKTCQLGFPVAVMDAAVTDCFLYLL